MTDTLRDVLAEALAALPPIPERFLLRKEWIASDWLPNAPDYADAIIAALAARNVVLARGDSAVLNEGTPYAEIVTLDRAAREDAPTPEPAPTLHFTGTYPQRAVYLPVYEDAPTPEPPTYAGPGEYPEPDTEHGQALASRLRIHHGIDFARSIVNVEREAAFRARGDARSPEPLREALMSKAREVVAGHTRVARGGPSVHDHDTCHECSMLWPCHAVLLARAALAATESPDTRALDVMTINENGRAQCVCGISVLPENWANHLLRADGQHFAALPPETPALHPDDGYAYEGCDGFACRTLRAASQALHQSEDHEKREDDR